MGWGLTAALSSLLMVSPFTWFLPSMLQRFLFPQGVTSALYLATVCFADILADMISLTYLTRVCKCDYGHLLAHPFSKPLRAAYLATLSVVWATLCHRLLWLGFSAYVRGSFWGPVLICICRLERRLLNAPSQRDEILLRQCAQLIVWLAAHCTRMRPARYKVWAIGNRPLVRHVLFYWLRSHSRTIFQDVQVFQYNNYNSCSRRFTMDCSGSPWWFSRSWRHVWAFEKRLADLRTWEPTDCGGQQNGGDTLRPVRSRRLETAERSRAQTLLHSTEVTTSFSLFSFSCFAWPNLFHTRGALWLQSLPWHSAAFVGSGSLCTWSGRCPLSFPSRSSAWNPEKTESQKT